MLGPYHACLALPGTAKLAGGSLGQFHIAPLLRDYSMLRKLGMEAAKQRLALLHSHIAARTAQTAALQRY